jgi:hypothetical protein
VTRGGVSERRRSVGKSYQQVLDEDRYPVPAVLRLSSDEEFDFGPIPPEYYFSREQHEAEVEKIWRRTWQIACREEEIPEVGDTEAVQLANYQELKIQHFYRLYPNSMKA